MPRPAHPAPPSDWVPGDKDGFGTARRTASKVWYTLSRGTLNEVFYPRIDTPSLRDSQFVVTDGSTFTDREDRDSTHQVQLLSSTASPTGWSTPRSQASGGSPRRS